jgi:hypothetical protein
VRAGTVLCVCAAIGLFLAVSPWRFESQLSGQGHHLRAASNRRRSAVCSLWQRCVAFLPGHGIRSGDKPRARGVHVQAMGCGGRPLTW